MDQEKNLILTLDQIRAARGLLGWSQTQLGVRAGLSLPTIKRAETGTGPRVSDEVFLRIKKALEAGGVQFIEENGGGAGVRWRKVKKKKT